jgi:hypothetical protein
MKTEVELHTLYGRERAFQEEIDSLRADSSTKDKLINGLENNNHAKLFHIRRLHAAIENLGLRHPMTHRTHDWDDLTDELPRMVQKIQNIDLKLKELELERDKLKDQEQDSEEDIVPAGLPSAPRPPSPVSGIKPSTSKDSDKDAKKKKVHRRSSEAKPPPRIRSPSPTSSDTSKANTSKFVRRKSKNHNNGSGFFFPN